MKGDMETTVFGQLILEIPLHTYSTCRYKSIVGFELTEGFWRGNSCQFQPPNPALLHMQILTQTWKSGSEENPYCTLSNAPGRQPGAKSWFLVYATRSNLDATHRRPRWRLGFLSVDNKGLHTVPYNVARNTLCYYIII